MNKLLGIIFIFFVQISWGQTTPIPDANFEQKLIDLGIDTNGLTGTILNNDAASVTFLNVNSSAINDLTGIEAFVNLETLICYQNNLTSLPIANNLLLKEIWCTNNNIDFLELADHTLLEELWCGANNLSSLNTSMNTNLRVLHCERNNLTNLDVSNNTSLTLLDFGFNQISSIDVSNNIHLTRLIGRANNFTTLNISQNLLIEDFIFESNQIESLDLSNHSQLVFVRIENNVLTSLNIKNGNNQAITTFKVQNNPSLVCIQVDDANAATNGVGVYASWEKDNTATYETVCGMGNLTYVPDDNFENYLETHDANGNLVTLGSPTSMGNGIAYDDYVFTNRINSVVNLDVHAKNIADLTGIEDFISLKRLDCFENNIEIINLNSNLDLEWLRCWENNLYNIDVTNNSKLKLLFCSTNNLTNLDVTNNFELEELSFDFNNLSGIDVFNNDKLTRLSCVHNNLINLDVSNNLELEFLYVNDNELVDLDVSQNTLLTHLGFRNNEISEVNLTNNTELWLLHCDYNKLSTIDVTNNLLLNNMTCDGNLITSIDLSNNSALESFRCSYSFNLERLDFSANTSLNRINCNQNPSLTEVNVKNGSNNILTLEAINNNLLECIQVDNEIAANTGVGIYSFWSKDSTAVYSEACSWSQALTYVPDDNFEQALIDYGFDNVLDDYVLTDNINQVENLFISNRGIVDLTGIEDFESLKLLNCNGNNLTELDLSNNKELQSMYCVGNNLDRLNVKNGRNGILRYFSAQNNPNLYCIEVDRPALANNGVAFYRNWIKDSHAIYRRNCSTSRNSKEKMRTNQSYSKTVKVYPNPATSNITIESTEAIKKLEIRDVNGRIVISQEYTNTIDVSELSKGLYLVTVVTESQNMVKKVLVE